MIYVVTFMPEAEEVFIKELSKYFNSEVRVSELFGSEFQTLNVSAIHPFSSFVESQINDTSFDFGVFPSLTVVEDDSSKRIDPGVHGTDVKISSEEVQDMIDNRDKYIVSQDTIDDLNTILSGKSYVFASQYATIITARMSLEIWSSNPIHKNRIYNLLQGFLLGQKRKEINDKWDIKIDQSGMTGSKSGNYNYDFGLTLYGASMQFNIDYPMMQYFIDESIEEIKYVDHYKENING